MKKNKKAKKLKAPLPEPQLPSLVEAMAKLVERLESMERKMDQVLSRVSNVPQYNPPHRSENTFPQSQAHTEIRKERMMYQAVCADCRKNCEVPFKPGDRPVYCKECFAIRKAGHRSQDPDSRSRAQAAYKKASDFLSIPTFTPASSGNVAVAKGKKKKSARPQGKKSGKKK